MRVSDSSLFLMNRTNVGQARSLLADAQLRAATGKRVNKPSDDPLATALARAQTATESRATAYLRTANAATTMLQVTDSTLSEVGSLIGRVRELAIQHSNDTLSPEQRAAAANEVEELRKQLVALGNTKTNGQYIFAGYADDTPPFDATGAYSGGTIRKELEVAPGVRVESSLTGDTVFGVAGGVDIMQVFNDIVTALQANDPTALRALLGSIDQGTSQVSAARAQAGSRLAAIDVARAAVESAQTQAQSSRADLVEIDQFSAYSDVARAEYALQSAVQLASMLPLQGLVGR